MIITDGSIICIRRRRSGFCTSRTSGFAHGKGYLPGSGVSDFENFQLPLCHGLQYRWWLLSICFYQLK